MILPHSVDGFGEADVREEIITPLLHRLGYKAGSRANIIREQPLRYPKEYLGHKKPRRDPPLRGRADYILDVDGLVRWTIEAKAPNALISVDDIEQAYSYARHPEVRAVFFAIINGAELRQMLDRPLDRAFARWSASSVESLNSSSAVRPSLCSTRSVCS
jgi:hypothetical protein